MTKRFVIAVDPLTATEEKSLKSALEGAAWWHWLPNFWLVVDDGDQFTTESIRNAIGKIKSSARCIVLEVDEKGWSGRMRPDAQKRDMGRWIRETWSPE